MKKKDLLSQNKILNEENIRLKEKYDDEYLRRKFDEEILNSYYESIQLLIAAVKSDTPVVPLKSRLSKMTNILTCYAPCDSLNPMIKNYVHLVLVENLKESLCDISKLFGYDSIDSNGFAWKKEKPC